MVVWQAFAKKAPAMPVGLRVLYGRWIRKGAESEVASII